MNFYDNNGNDTMEDNDIDFHRKIAEQHPDNHGVIVN